MFQLAGLAEVFFSNNLLKIFQAVRATCHLPIGNKADRPCTGLFPPAKWEQMFPMADWEQLFPMTDWEQLLPIALAEHTNFANHASKMVHMHRDT